MDKIIFIQKFIDRCEVIINSKNINDARKIEDEIISIFANEIATILRGLDDHDYSGSDYLLNVELLKQKLLNYQANIKEEHKKMEHELKLAQLSQPTVSVHAEASPVQNQSANLSATVTVNLDFTLKLIDEISNDSLSIDDKEQLTEKLYSFEGVRSMNDKSKTWDKAKDILKFVANKGADAAIAVLPLVLAGL